MADIHPREWSEFVGQQAHKRTLDIRVRAALEQVRPLDHILIVGPPGMGKSTLARIIASRVSDNFLSLGMPLKPNILMKELRNFDGGVLFLDEIHRLKGQQEDLLPLLLEGWYQTPDGKRVEHGWLTIIGATTEEEKIIPPLHQRFPIYIKLEPYSIQEMASIIEGMSERIKLDLTKRVINGLGQASAGNPRLAERLVLAARDLDATNQDIHTHAVLKMCGVDSTGLGQNHAEYLNCLRSLGGTAGLTTISAMLRLHETVIRDIERLLVERNYVSFSAKGRELTSKGWQYFKDGKTPRRRRQ